MLRIALVLLMTTAFVGLAAPAPQAANPDGYGDATAITLLFHGSVQGMITDCGCKKKPLGGLARRAAFVEAARAECGPQDCCLLVDAGSLMGRISDEGLIQTEFLMAETALLGYQAVGVGSWDLRNGVDAVLAAEIEGVPYTNANLFDAESGEPAFTPYRVSEIGGVRFGMISVVSALGLEGVELDGLRMESPREALQNALPGLREQCDVVILLAQVKIGELRPMLEDLQEDPGTQVEIAVEGMGSAHYARPSQVGETWLLAANNLGKVLGRAELLVAEDGEILDIDLVMQELSLDMPEDPAVAERVAAFQESTVEMAKTQ